MKRHLPYLLLFAYLGLGFCYGLAYWRIPNILSCTLGFWDAMYFSVVTITTLGYGDISPITGVGKFLCASEAIFGVLILGWFLLAVSNKLAYEGERNRINAAKENLKYKYYYWRVDTSTKLYELARHEEAPNLELRKSIHKIDSVREYFTADAKRDIHTLALIISSEDKGLVELRSYLDRLRDSIEAFTGSIPIAEQETLKQFTKFTVGLHRTSDIDVHEFHERYTFLEDIWVILACLDNSTKYRNTDELIELIDSV